MNRSCSDVAGKTYLPCSRIALALQNDPVARLSSSLTHCQVVPMQKALAVPYTCRPSPGHPHLGKYVDETRPVRNRAGEARPTVMRSTVPAAAEQEQAAQVHLVQAHVEASGPSKQRNNVHGRQLLPCC